MHTRAFQRGALFGLDARIAIGVFAILAVVVSYVAFSRIQTAKETALVAQIEALDDALNGYQTDMGTFYLFTLKKQDGEVTTSAHDLEALWNKDLVLSGFAPHWNGPYLHVTTRQTHDYGRFTVIYAQGNRKDYCSTDSDCYVWIALTKVPAKIWKQMNLMIDEGGGKYHESEGADISEGRVQADGNTDPRTLFYRSVGRPDE